MTMPVPCLKLLDAIHGYVRSKRNVTLDRVALEEWRQEEGKTFDEYYIALREIANNADLCKVCMDDRLTTRIMSGIREPETKRKLLAHTPPPSLQTTLNRCRSEESEHNDEHLRTVNMFPQKLTQFTNTDNINPASLDFKISLRQKATSVAAIVGKCVTNNATTAQPSKANAPIAKKLGHWAACCRQKQRIDTTHRTSAMNGIRVLDVIGNKQRLRALT